MIENEVKKIIEFSECLGGIYSNKKQFEENPKNYALINIYFIPLKWSIFKEPSFYSEQSYDFAPWSPYRQGIHVIKMDQEKIIVKNYKAINQERLAGSGFMPELLKEIDKAKITARSGCNMHFHKIMQRHYQGNIESGDQCLIKKNGVSTYLSSKINLKYEELTTLDEGFNVNTGEKVWGSEYGSLRFLKIKKIDDYIKKEWF